MDGVVDFLLLGAIPFKIKYYAMQNPLLYNDLNDAFVQSSDKHVNTV